jgi:hypothetical protein
MESIKNEFDEKESLRLISTMIYKAKNSYHDTGLGPILWGSVITLCSLVTFLQIKYSFDLPFDIWFLTLIAIVPQIFIASRAARNSKVKGYDDKMLDYVWMCFGISIFLLIFINNSTIAALRPIFEKYRNLTGAKPDFVFSSYTTPLFLLLYGIPTIITGSCRNMKPMLYGGIVCWICCIISIYTTIDWDMLLTALAATCAWLIPGIILWRKHKKLKSAHV